MADKIEIGDKVSFRGILGLTVTGTVTGMDHSLHDKIMGDLIYVTPDPIVGQSTATTLGKIPIYSNRCKLLQKSNSQIEIKKGCYYWAVLTTVNAMNPEPVFYDGKDISIVGSARRFPKEEFKFFRELSYEDSACDKLPDPPKIKKKCPHCQNGYYLGLGHHPRRKCEECAGLGEIEV